MSALKNHYKNLQFIVLVIAVALLSGCLRDPEASRQQLLDDQFALDQAVIEDYLLINGITATQDTVVGLYYVIDEQGDGPTPEVTDSIRVDYEAKYLGYEGIVESQSSQTYKLENLIVGWRVLLPYLKEGGTMTMYLPRTAAFDGENMIYEVKLIEVK